MRQDPITTALMERHEDAALLTLGLILVTGTLSLAGLWQTYRDGRMAKGMTAAILLFSILTVGMVMRTGNTGGDIRHTEVRPTPTTGWLRKESSALFVHAFRAQYCKGCQCYVI